MLRIGVLPLLLAAASISAQEAASPGQEPVAWWPLDEVLDQGSPDRPGRKSDPVEGSHRLVAGVAGSPHSTAGRTAATTSARCTA